MNLTVQDVAALLRVPESSIKRWISERGFPAHRVDDQLRFHRTEIIEWATAERIDLPVDLLEDSVAVVRGLPSLSEALEAGGIHPNVGGTDRDQVLREIVARLPLQKDSERDQLLGVLIAREALGSTGVGDGIAIPHARCPIVMRVPRASVSLCMLDNPIDFGAMDGKPVSTMFVVVSPTVRAHLHLLARIASALRNQDFRDAVRKSLGAEVILQAARAAEAGLPRAASLR